MQEMQTLNIPTPTEFSFSECMRYLRRSTLECMHQTTPDTLIKAVRLQGTLVIFEVSAQPGKLTVQYLDTTHAPGTAAALKAYLTELFDLQTDLAPFYRMAAQDAVLSQVVPRYAGLRLIGIPDLFEALCWAIIGQQINLRFAYTLKQRFVMEWGETVMHRRQPLYLFPSPARIAGLPTADLRPLQFSSRKAAYLIGVAQALESGVISKEKLQAMPYPEAVDKLTQLKGIGQWTSHYVMMKCLRMPDAFPIDDVGLHHALRHAMQLKQKPDLLTIEKLSKAWTGWLSYTTFYLWHSLADHD